MSPVAVKFPTEEHAPDVVVEGKVVPSTAVGAFPRPPTFSSKLDERKWLKFRLAQAFRIFAKQGYDEGIAGHITVRDPIRTDCFWVNPFGLHFALIQSSDLILVDHHGAVQPAESGPNTLLNRAAFMIHSAIHAARPDVLCAAHSHSIHGRAFAALGKELDMITQDSCVFYKDHAVYKQFGGVVLDEEEGQRIVQTLGAKKAVILQNHGLLVATSSIEATVNFFISMEKSCHVQLMAEAAAVGMGGKTIKIGEEEAAITYATVGSMNAGWFGGRPYFQVLEAQEGVTYNPSSSK
ncbi:class II aldolase/adducin domain-containing protein [Epithele typhae]|uniref:class II aldolase/adducin domain-containing protein n=1 Tax=Epithele typhae TaxID=378194 RepID=UPI002007E0AB|nr:class II aldolase/adducin domain-containing protein [Epithele typhae]KAH9946355.1 class II aldolase/adducin domain-containing protein [Epithele typhae]